MIRRPPRSTRTDPPFPTRRSSDLAARTDLQRHFIALGRVGGFDSTVKGEAAVVGDPNGFFVSVEADDSADWSEDFFLCDGHAVIDVIEQGKLGEEALGQVLGAAAAMDEPPASVAAKANEMTDLCPFRLPAHPPHHAAAIDR